MRVLLAIAFALATSGVAVAADDQFGAVGVNPKTGYVAFAAGATKDDAERKIDELCKKDNADCRDKHWYTNECVSLARSADNRTFGLSIKHTRAAAQQDALKTCGHEGGKGCNIHDTYCAPAQ